ncbi:MAG: hypothetical protein ACI83B_001375 [Sediminicola sp.]|jgi:hypothetical protein|tara:strand:+ start:2993 stop:3163 length:171 start_codon:yes stop_codon:yes gene_type:complete
MGRGLFGFNEIENFNTSVIGHYTRAFQDKVNQEYKLNTKHEVPERLFDVKVVLAKT